MKNQMKMLFRQISTGKLFLADYNPDKNFRIMIKNAQKEGFSGIHITLNMCLDIIQNLVDKNFSIKNIDLYQFDIETDPDLTREINTCIAKINLTETIFLEELFKLLRENECGINSMCFQSDTGRIKINRIGIIISENYDLINMAAKLIKKVNDIANINDDNLCMEIETLSHIVSDTKLPEKYRLEKEAIMKWLLELELYREIIKLRF